MRLLKFWILPTGQNFWSQRPWENINPIIVRSVSEWRWKIRQSIFETSPLNLWLTKCNTICRDPPKIHPRRTVLTWFDQPGPWENAPALSFSATGCIHYRRQPARLDTYNTIHSFTHRPHTELRYVHIPYHMLHAIIMRAAANAWELQLRLREISNHS